MGNITLKLLIHSLGALKIQTSAGTLGSHSISSLLGDGKGFVISQFLTYFVRVEVKASCDRNMPCKYKEEELHLNTSSNLDRRGLCSCQRNFQEGLQEQFPSVGSFLFQATCIKGFPGESPQGAHTHTEGLQGFHTTVSMVQYEIRHLGLQFITHKEIRASISMGKGI